MDVDDDHPLILPPTLVQWDSGAGRRVSATFPASAPARYLADHARWRVGLPRSC
jgi:hypothetical protein